MIDYTYHYLATSGVHNMTAENTQIVDWNTWASVMSESDCKSPEFHAWIPVHAGLYLEPVLDGFITEPSNNPDHIMETVVTSDIIEFRDNLASQVLTGTSFFLYMPVWIAKQPIFQKFDPDTSSLIICDPPEWVNGKWKITFAKSK